MRGRLRLEQRCVQLLHEPETLIAIDDERQVQVVGRLRDEMHLVRFEHGECRPEPMQDHANIATDEAHRRTIAQDTDTAGIAERRRQAFELGRRQRIGARIDRHRDIALRCRYEINGHAVFGEYRENPREEADFLPHGNRLHRHQCQILPQGNCLERRVRFLDDATDQRAGQLRARRAAYV